MSAEQSSFKSSELSIENVGHGAKVTIYSLNDPQEKGNFFKSLRAHALGIGRDNDRFLLWRLGNDEPAMLDRAVELGFLKDELPLQAIDYAKLKGEVALGERRRIGEKVNSLEALTIAEFSWLNEEKFVTILPYKQMREVVFSRNKGVFSDEAYEKLRTTKIAIIGAGVGFSIAEVLMWLGAENLIVVDGGTVAPHDTQRLPSSGVHSYGLNHAIHFLQRAYDFFPYGNYNAIANNVGIDENSDTLIGLNKILNWVGMDGLVLEEVDQLYLKGEIRRRAKVPVFMGSDVALAGTNQVHRPDQSLFGGRLTDADMDQLKTYYLEGTEMPREFKTDVVRKVMGNFLTPDFMRAFGQVIQSGGEYWPQSGIAARLSSAIVGAAIMEYLEGHPIKDELMIDLRTAVRQ